MKRQNQLVIDGGDEHGDGDGVVRQSADVGAGVYGARGGGGGVHVHANVEG